MAKSAKHLNQMIEQDDLPGFVEHLRQQGLANKDLVEIFQILKQNATAIAIRYGMALLRVEPDLINNRMWQTQLAALMSLSQTDVFRTWVQLAQKEKAQLRDFLHQLPNTPKLQPWANLTATLPPENQAPPKQKKNSESLVYIVDDSRIIQNMLGRLVKQFGIKHRIFGLAQDAQDALGEEQPDLIFTDLNMPGKNGLEMTREIRTQHTSADLPMVLVTAPEEVQSEKDLMDVGIDRVIPKPFNKQLVGDVLIQFGLIEDRP